MTPLTSIDPPAYIARDVMLLEIWNEVAPRWIANGWLYRCTLAQLESVVCLRAVARTYREADPKYVEAVGGGLVNVNRGSANAAEGAAIRFELDHCPRPQVN